MLAYIATYLTDDKLYVLSVLALCASLIATFIALLGSVNGREKFNDIEETFDKESESTTNNSLIK